jgi:hypothetical protein
MLIGRVEKVLKIMARFILTIPSPISDRNEKRDRSGWGGVLIGQFA